MPPDTSPVYVPTTAFELSTMSTVMLWLSTFTLLSDPKSEVIDRYGLRDPAYPVGNKAHGAPKPVIFVVARDGTIKAKLFEESFKNRPSLALLLETIDKVK